MPVAKSYLSYNIVSDVYSVNGKEYVKIQHPRTGNIRQARWYTDAEWAKLYPEEVNEDNTRMTKTQRDVLGFEKGYITIFKGDVESCEDWLRSSNARYARMWGWYIISTEEVPPTLPQLLEPVRLPWHLVGNKDGTLKNDSAIATALADLMYSESPSQYQGEVGDRLELAVCITQNIPLHNEYGSSTLHIMEDTFENVYVWITSAKSWPIGSQKVIRGTVKEHKLYKGVKQTVLTRCAEKL